MTGHGSLAWLARHEARLAWRDSIAMLQGGRRSRMHWAVLAVIVISTILHLIAYAVVSPGLAALAHPDKAALVVITGSACLAWSLMLSQAMESMTRSFYARGDLDLILSSPASGRRLFLIRISAIAATVGAMAIVLVGPFINVAAFLVGPQFLLAYGVLVAMACTATAVAVVATAGMFQLLGPKRTRLVAQIMAAIVGAGFVITIQAIAVVSYGSLSRLRIFQSPEWVAAAPGLTSYAWWPVRAAMGDSHDLLFVLAGAFIIFFLAALSTAGLFAQNAIAVSVIARATSPSPARLPSFRTRSKGQALCWKEWTLLVRDPWLLSQSLMQVLYLVPPALLLWRNFETAAGFLVLVPVIVMAAGQLAGGLAWLAISGEDAPDLIATAPVTSGSVLRAKITAVFVAVALPVLPLACGIAWASPIAGFTTIAGAALACGASCAIQFLFRSQAKRSNFRRRQTSSRFATFAEALTSISIAGAAALTAAGLWLAIVPGAIALCILIAARQLTKA